MDEWTKDNNPSWGSGWGEGDIMFEDLNGDKVINEGANTVDDPGDRKIIGNSTPRFRFGLDLGVEWKGIDFSMFWQGVAKRDLWLDGPMFWGISGGEWQSTGLKEHLDYYRPEKYNFCIWSQYQCLFSQNVYEQRYESKSTKRVTCKTAPMPV